MIDGRSLHTLLGSPGDIAPLGVGSREGHEEYIDMLRLVTPSGMVEGRRALYVCSECGDLGCGAISAVVSREGGAVVWKDFAFYCTFHFIDDQPAETPLIKRERYAHIGPFRFEARAYDEALLSTFAIRDALHSEDEGVEDVCPG